MVAATNTNVLMKSLSTTPATSAANGKGAVNDAADASGSGDDGDFMTLLNSLLGDNTATPDPSQNTTATTVEKKDDSKTDASTDLPQWLLSPLTQPNVQPPLATAASQEDGVETIDALTPGNNAATNAMLAQSLKRLGSEKGTASSQSTDQPADGVAALLANGNADQSALNGLLGKSDTALQANAMLNGIDADKGSAHSGSESANQTASGVTPLTAFQTSINDINNAAPKYDIHAHVGTREWTTEVGNQLTMMVSHKIQSASLQLSPDNLGPMQVRIDVNNNQASVWFTADHAATRTALEQSLPHLRELFASQGMSLMDAGVFGQQSQQQQASTFNNNPQPSFGMTDMSSEATMTQQVMKIGLLDTYA